MADMKLADLVCKHCGRKVAGLETEDWVVEHTSGRFSAAICPTCFPKFGAQEDAQILRKMNSEPIFSYEAPKAGNFRPVKDLPETNELRDCGEFGSSWWDLEFDIFEILRNGYKMIKLGVQTGEFDEIWIKYEWSGNQIRSLSVIGDRPKKSFEYSVYQRARMQKMGLRENGEINKDWSLELTSTEMEFKNIARITSHILQFGLLLQQHKIHGLTPIIDTEK